MFWQIATFAILLVFYGIYLGKMIHQKKKGIQTDQIAKGQKRDKVYYTELALKIATYSIVVVGNTTCTGTKCVAILADG